MFYFYIDIFYIDKKPPVKKEGTYMDVYAIVNKPKKKNTGLFVSIDLMYIIQKLNIN